MKRLLTTGALIGATMFALAPEASARDTTVRWRFGFGLGDHGVNFRFGVGNTHRGTGPGRRGHGRLQRRYDHVVDHARHAPRRHVHVRVPVYHRVWVAPLYRTIVVGYDHCHRPIHRRVMVRPGYYRQVLQGHRCQHCDLHF